MEDFKSSEKIGIFVESIVKLRSLDPAVNIKWGKNEGQLTPTKARQHAFGVLEAAASADLDAAVMRWATQKLNMSPKQAVQLLRLFRQKRETSQLPSCTMHIGDEHIRPDTARKRALFLLNNAFNTEIEAFLAVFILEDLERSPDVVDILIQEFRAIRGLQTDWNQEGGDRDERTGI
jgi:hypothetical protein